MEPRNGGALALALVCLLCCLAGGASAAYSVPADPRRHPSPGPGRGGYYHGPAPAASPRRHHHRQHALSPAPASPHHAPSPSPTAGADGLPSHPPAPVYTRAPEPQATTTPHFGFPLEPTVGVTAGGPSGALPKKGDGEGYPFIGSNPTVPLPTGVTDTATVRPLADTSNNDDNAKVAGRAAEPVRAGAAMIGLLMAVLSTIAMSS